MKQTNQCISLEKSKGLLLHKFLITLFSIYFLATISVNYLILLHLQAEIENNLQTLRVGSVTDTHTLYEIKEVNIHI